MPVLLRCLAAFALLTGTFNPTEYNFVSWAQNSWAEQLSLVVLVGVVLFIAYIVFLRATLRSIGKLGMMLFSVLFGVIIWVLVDFGFVNIDNPEGNTWIALIGLSLMLGIGLSWSIVRRRISGQYDVDDIDA